MQGFIDMKNNRNVTDSYYLRVMKKIHLENITFLPNPFIFDPKMFRANLYTF